MASTPGARPWRGDVPGRSPGSRLLAVVLAFPPLRAVALSLLRAYSAGLRAGFTPASLFSAANSGTWMLFAGIHGKGWRVMAAGPAGACWPPNANFRSSDGGPARSPRGLTGGCTILAPKNWGWENVSWPESCAYGGSIEQPLTFRCGR